MTADQSPPAFSEMGEEIAKGWESLQEDMQRLIMDSDPTSEPGSPMGGATHDHHDSPRSPVDDGDFLPVSERPAGTSADGHVEGSARDIGEKVGGWFRAFAAEIAGVFDDRVLDNKPRDRGGTASMTAAVGNVDDGRGHGVTSDDAYTRERGGASSADEAGGPVSRGGSKSEDPGGGSTPRVGPGAGFIPLFAESIQGQGDGRDGYYTDGDDPFRHLLSSERVQSNGFNRPNAAVDVSAQSTSASALETQRLWGNPGRFVSFEDCAEVLRSLPEADDAMAAGAARYCDEVDKVLLLTPDKDLAQCVTGQRVVMYDRRREIEIDEAGVHEKWGVAPTSIAAGSWRLEGDALKFDVKTSGMERGDISLPSDSLHFRTAAWGGTMASKGNLMLLQTRFGFRREWRMVGVFKAEPLTTNGDGKDGDGEDGDGDGDGDGENNAERKVLLDSMRVTSRRTS